MSSFQVRITFTAEIYRRLVLSLPGVAYKAVYACQPAGSSPIEDFPGSRFIKPTRRDDSYEGFHDDSFPGRHVRCPFTGVLLEQVHAQRSDCLMDVQATIAALWSLNDRIQKRTREEWRDPDPVGFSVSSS